jgi:molybdate transport system substrate-binding protein
MRFCTIPTLILALLWVDATRAEPRTLTIAAAANLAIVLDEIVTGFEKENPGVAVRVSCGASGAMYAQIENGAPFDIFLSAEGEMPRKLAEAGRSRGGPFVYAFGKLALWVPNDSKLDVEKRGVEALLDQSVRRIAIANPAVAPYGVAAEAALRSSGVYDRLKAKLVLGKSVQQAAQFAQSGNAQAAFLPVSLVTAPPLGDEGRYVLVPPGAYPPIEQAGIILETSKSSALAEIFTAYLLGAHGRAALEKSGFDLPTAK